MITNARRCIALLISIAALSFIANIASAFTADDVYNTVFHELTNSFPKEVTACITSAKTISNDPVLGAVLNPSEDVFNKTLQNLLLNRIELNLSKDGVAGVVKRVTDTLYSGGAAVAAVPAPVLVTPVPDDSKALGKILRRNLKAARPTIDSYVVAGEAGKIIGKCSGFSDADSLASLLDAELISNPVLGLANEKALRAKIVSDVVYSIYPAPRMHPWLDRPTPKANATGSPWHVSLWTGARLETPYTIDVTNGVGKLHSSKASSDGYIEIELNSRYVTRNGIADDVLFWPNGEATQPTGIPHFVCPFDRLGDIDARFGYVFRNSSAPDSFNASTVAGGSDIYADTSLGLPLAQICGTNYSWKGQVSIEIAGGFATDKEHLNIHPNLFCGMGVQASFTATGFGSTNYQGFWYGRAGMALVDEPSFTNKGTNADNTVALNRLGEPEFDLHWVPSVGTVIVYPLNSWLSLQTGVDAYFTPRPPALWNLNIGVTLNIDKVFGALLKSSTASTTESQ